MGTTCVSNNLHLVLTHSKDYIYVFLSFYCVSTRWRLLQTHVVPIKLYIYVFLSFDCVYLTWWVRRMSVITFIWYSYTQKTGTRRYLTWWVRRVSVVRYLRFPVFWLCECRVKVITDTCRTHQGRYYLTWWVRRVSVITFTWYSHTQKTGKRRYRLLSVWVPGEGYYKHTSYPSS
jgi:hypothetical protein